MKINILDRIYRHKILFAFLSTVLMLSAVTVMQTTNTSVVKTASIVGLVIGAVIGVVVAVALIPTIANQTTSLENNDDLSETEQTLVGLWPLFVIIGVMMAIIGFAM